MISRQPDGEIGRQTNGEADRYSILFSHINRQTDRQTDTQTVMWEKKKEKKTYLRKPEIWLTNSSAVACVNP